MHEVNQGREKQNLEMRIGYKTHAMKYFTPMEVGYKYGFKFLRSQE